MKFLPSAPLIEAARAGRPWHLPKGCEWCDHNRGSALCVSQKDIAVMVGANQSTVAGWVKGGRVYAWEAERFASALGLLDIEVWPELLDVPLPQRPPPAPPSPRGAITVDELDRVEAQLAAALERGRVLGWAS
mgnify:CR=1 FL=1